MTVSRSDIAIYNLLNFFKYIYFIYILFYYFKPGVK